MNTELQQLTIKSLRNLLILESKKFVWALELGATVSDLEEIRDRMRQITDLIYMKERGNKIEESVTQNATVLPNNLALPEEKNSGI